MNRPESIGEMVRQHRKRSGLTQMQLANLAGIGKSTVFDIEKGKASVRLDNLLKVLAVLNIKLEPQSQLTDEVKIEFSEPTKSEKYFAVAIPARVNGKMIKVYVDYGALRKLDPTPDKDLLKIYEEHGQAVRQFVRTQIRDGQINHNDEVFIREPHIWVPFHDD